MAIAPQNNQGVTRSVGTFSPGKGYDVLKGLTNISKSNSPVLNPPVLLGSDSARIDLLKNPSNLLSFPNLVHRTNQANTLVNLSAQGAFLTIPSGATLQYILSGVPASPVVITSRNIRIGGGTLGAGTYRLFLAQVDPLITSGIVYAQLYYQS
jgi:hypothetical protein